MSVRILVHLISWEISSSIRFMSWRWGQRNETKLYEVWSEVGGETVNDSTKYENMLDDSPAKRLARVRGLKWRGGLLALFYTWEPPGSHLEKKKMEKKREKGKEEKKKKQKFRT